MDQKIEYVIEELLALVGESLIQNADDDDFVSESDDEYWALKASK